MAILPELLIHQAQVQSHHQVVRKAAARFPAVLQVLAAVLVQVVRFQFLHRANRAIPAVQFLPAHQVAVRHWQNNATGMERFILLVSRHKVAGAGKTRRVVLRAALAIANQRHLELYLRAAPTLQSQIHLRTARLRAQLQVLFAAQLLAPSLVQQ